MMSLLRFLILSFILLGCQKEGNGELHEAADQSSSRETSKNSLVTCDDTSGVKAMTDLLPMEYLADCYLCKVRKEVPGLGSADWIMNSTATIGTSAWGLTFETFVEFNGGPFFASREVLSFTVPKLSTGFFILEDANYIRLESDGDVIAATYNMDTTCTNFVEITQLDLECQEVRGRFELHFILEDLTAGIIFSDRVNFLEGNFEARIKKFF